MGLWCRCACHSTKLGDLHDAMHRQNPSAVAYYSTDDRFDIPPLVDLFSQLESLVACSRCCGHHVRLNAPPPKYKPPTNWTPDATGEGD